MDEKLKRECRSYLEKLFKKNDDLGSGAVSTQGMKKILKEMISDYIHDVHDAEANELMKGMGKSTKYTSLNKSTNQFDVRYQENSIDFPSALYLCVYFLKKIEFKGTDSFSGRNVVKFDDVSSKKAISIDEKDKPAHNRKLF